MNPEDIERRFRNDVEAAESWRDANPERYSAEVNAANNRRADAYRDMAATATAEGNAAKLATARTTALTQYPEADPGAITGTTAEEIAASAQRSHDFNVARTERVLADARVARRPGTQQQWTGSAGGRAGLPGGEIRQPESVQQSQVQAAYERTREIMQEAKKPGTNREFSDDTRRKVLNDQDPEAQAMADYRLLHPNTGLSDVAMKARSEGTAQFVPSGSEQRDDGRG